MAAIDQLEGFPSGQESCVLLVALGSLGDALPLVALADALCGLLARVRVVVSAETYEQLARILGDDASLARVSALSPATGVFGGVADGDAAAAREAAAAAELELVHEAALSLLRGVPQSCRFLGFNAHSAHAFHVAEAVRAAPVLCAPTVEPAGDERSGWAAGLAAPWYAPWRRTKRVWRGGEGRAHLGAVDVDAAVRATRRLRGVAPALGAAVYGGGAPAPSKRRAAGWEWAAARGEESALVFSGYWRPRDLRFDHARVPAALLRGEPKSGGGERRALVCFGSVPLASLGVDEARFFRVMRRAVARAGFRAFFHGGPRPDDGDWCPGADFVDHDLVLRSCDVLISHGGAGAVHAAAARGVGHVVVSLHADQARWGGAVAALGLGVHVAGVTDRLEGAVDGLAAAVADAAAATAARRRAPLEGLAAPSAALGLPLDPALAAACAMLFDGATATTLCSYAAERARRRAAWLDRKAAAGLYLSRRMPPGTSVEVAAFCAFLFVPRPAYGGPRPGAVFRAGDRGVGYYPDPY